ncbi:MAG TPA: Gfo/Idh/MocA family oxidoreductase [Armatimonadota bacterium]|jgi:predicted dehydrogenase
MIHVNVGLIGCGSRMRDVFRLLQQQSPHITLVAVCDPSQASIEKTLQEFACETAVTIHQDYHDLARDPNVDWVMIGSWNCFHAEQAIAAFESGKHVFCEKPLATTFDDCLAMRKAWQQSGKEFAIGFTLRYSPHYRAIRQLLCDGLIGELVSMEFNETLNISHGGFIHSDWRRFTENAGPHILEKCSHDIDIAHWLVGSLPVKVASFGGNRFFTKDNAATMERARAENPQWQWMHDYIENWKAYMQGDLEPFTAEKDIIDHQVAILKFANGVQATFHTNCAAGIFERRLYLCGTTGTIRADVYTGEITASCFIDEGKRHDYSTTANGGHGGGDDVLAAELAQVMLEGIRPPATLLDGLSSAITCFALDEAMRTESVVDLTAWWQRADIALPGVAAIR